MLRTMLISFSAIIAIGAASSSAYAYCDLNGDPINATQSNNTIAEFSKIRQKGTRLQGNAKFRDTYGVFNGYLTDAGNLKITVRWGDGTSGVYYGLVTSDGYVLNGTTHEVGNLGNSATWYSRDRLQCAR